MEGDGSVPHEVEAAALIRSDEAEVIRHLETLTEVAGYHLVPAPDRHIVDTYFDIPSGDGGQSERCARSTG